MGGTVFQCCRQERWVGSSIPWEAKSVAELAYLGIPWLCVGLTWLLLAWRGVACLIQRSESSSRMLYVACVSWK